MTKIQNVKPVWIINRMLMPVGTSEFPIHKCDFFPLGKAAQKFAARRTLRRPQPETCYDRQDS